MKYPVKLFNLSLTTLDKQNNTFARASLFCVHSLAFTARLQRKLPNFPFMEDVNTKTTTSFFFWTCTWSLRIELQENSPTFAWLNDKE